MTRSRGYRTRGQFPLYWTLWLDSTFSPSQNTLGYLLKVLTAAPLPTSEADFHDLLAIWFPRLYDIKYIVRSLRPVMKSGALQEVADEFAVSESARPATEKPSSCPLKDPDQTRARSGTAHGRSTHCVALLQGAKHVLRERGDRRGKI